MSDILLNYGHIAHPMTIFCTFQSYVSKSGVRLFPYYLLAYIMPPLYKR